MLTRPQPPPANCRGPEVWPAVLEASQHSDATKADIKERDGMGTAKYGTPLRVWNCRDAAVDAYQELLDLRVYLEQCRLRLLEGWTAGTSTDDQAAALGQFDRLTAQASAMLEELGEIARTGVVPK